MKFPLYLLLCFAATAASMHASPVLYTINFTVTSGSAPSASFFYDSAAALGSQFSNFDVVGNGHTIDLTAVANSGPVNGVSPGCIPAADNSASSFAVLSGTICQPTNATLWYFTTDPGIVFYDGLTTSGAGFGSYVVIPGSVNGNLVGQGSWTISAATANPEPSTLGLMAIGGALLGWIRKRPNS